MKTSTFDAKPRDALEALGAAAPANAMRTLVASRAKLDELELITGQLVELSRRNTNVLSLDLALRQQPPLAAACARKQRALSDVLVEEGPKPER